MEMEGSPGLVTGTGANRNPSLSSGSSFGFPELAGAPLRRSRQESETRELQAGVASGLERVGTIGPPAFGAL